MNLSSTRRTTRADARSTTAAARTATSIRMVACAAGTLLALTGCTAPAPPRAGSAPTPAAASPPAPVAGGAQDSPGLEGWRGFVAALRAGPLPLDHMRPYRADAAEPLRGFLTSLSRATTERALWHEWSTAPEVYRVGDHTHVVVALSAETADRAPHTYCFTFVVEQGQWYFYNLESILLRLDRVPPPPTSTFPEAPESQLAWMRAELGLTEDVRLYRFLTREHGSEAALEYFRGREAGYAFAARTWVPFVDPARAFVLYAAWEQARLRGNQVVIERLDDQEAVLSIHSLELRVYARASHLRSRIGLAELRRLIETAWTERARHAGFRAELRFGDDGRYSLLLRRNR